MGQSLPRKDIGIQSRHLVSVHMAPIGLQLTLIFTDGKKTAYFRGRKLYGNEVELPQGFQGYLFQKTDRIVPKGTAQTAEEDEDVEDGDVKVLEEQLKFDHIVVWGHQQVPEDTDPFLKGIKEMLSFTERVCGTCCN